jgi:hypothetical protein
MTDRMHVRAFYCRDCKAWVDANGDVNKTRYDHARAHVLEHNILAHPDLMALNDQLDYLYLLDS